MGTFSMLVLVSSHVMKLYDSLCQEGCLAEDEAASRFGQAFNEACANFDFPAFLSNCRADHFTSCCTPLRGPQEKKKEETILETLMGSLSHPPGPAGEGGRFQKLLSHLCAAGRAGCQLEQHLVSSFLVFIAVKMVFSIWSPTCVMCKHPAHRGLHSLFLD